VDTGSSNFRGRKVKVGRHTYSTPLGDIKVLSPVSVLTEGTDLFENAKIAHSVGNFSNNSTAFSRNQQDSSNK
jgi:hypothetical protein